MIIDYQNKTFLYQSVVDELQRYDLDTHTFQELKKDLLEIGRKLMLSEEDYINDVKEVSQEGFLKSIQFMKKNKRR